MTIRSTLLHRSEFSLPTTALHAAAGDRRCCCLGLLFVRLALPPPSTLIIVVIIIPPQAAPPGPPNPTGTPHGVLRAAWSLADDAGCVYSAPLFPCTANDTSTAVDNKLVLEQFFRGFPGPPCGQGDSDSRSACHSLPSSRSDGIGAAIYWL